MRKHVELFINAGLDFICFDCTNNDFYQAAAKAVLDVLPNMPRWATTCRAPCL
ncbi:MAG: hypothetical protein ACLRTQ_00685 [Candidatus Borkfalkia sp.]